MPKGVERSDEELRQVLAEVGLELLDAVDEGEQRIARALRAELAGAQGRDLIEDPGPNLKLYQGGGMVRRHGAPVFEDAARQHGGGHGDRLRKHHDDLRRAVILEPRGSDALVGALLCRTPNAGCAAGVIFFNNVGYLGMCGHGAIGVAVTLAHLGRVGTGGTQSRHARRHRGGGTDGAERGDSRECRELLLAP